VDQDGTCSLSQTMRTTATSSTFHRFSGDDPSLSQFIDLSITLPSPNVSSARMASDRGMRHGARRQTDTSQPHPHVDFHDEATYFGPLGHTNAFVEFVLAFLLAPRAFSSSTRPAAARVGV